MHPHKGPRQHTQVAWSQLSSVYEQTGMHVAVAPACSAKNASCATPARLHAEAAAVPHANCRFSRASSAVSSAHAVSSAEFTARTSKHPGNAVLSSVLQKTKGEDHWVSVVDAHAWPAKGQLTSQDAANCLTKGQCHRCIGLPSFQRHDGLEAAYRKDKQSPAAESYTPWRPLHYCY